MNTEQEKKMFGCTLADFRQSVQSSITFQASGAGMVAMSLMSDAQEEIARGMTEDARQTLNRAKWVVSEYLMQQRRS